ncbi:probable SCO1-involved in stabilization of Cox1p and Cox2p [Serendipita indica DSM 11827]|uniref:Probable SCO1-involved in stabilization of Cox1p and Cox2p n=1 Tax=Serendipita indica (strain DSM 11827) TaxID=1109443 RepID=G4TB00_SERID|nr:probable SCO1-involved in stabilization of Cox1p and Cox2p [Serendipita indica DSM 11827]
MASRCVRQISLKFPKAGSTRALVPRITTRGFATSRRVHSDEPSFQRAKDKAAVGVFDWKAAGIFVVTGIGLYYYFEHHKAQVQEEKRQELKKARYGKAFVGGPFELVNAQTKTPFTQDNLLGHWSLIYFGFTNCPDVCPEELDKMTEVVDRIEKEHDIKVQPIFISCDPARDTSDQLEKYLADFHPRMIGLTGTYEQVKAACKSYRVYFSTPPNAKPGDDYLVDHSIFFYLMDPAGNFVEAFGKSSTADVVCTKFNEGLLDWKERPMDQRT